MSELSRYPLCWPDNVARTRPADRRRPQFMERTIYSAVRDLLREINRLNRRRFDYEDQTVILSTNLRLNKEGLPRSDQGDPADPGVAVYFKLQFQRNGKQFERPIVLTCDRWSKICYNLTAISKDIEAQRARDRWGCTNIEQAFRGYVAIPERCGGKSWWEELSISSDAGEAEIKAAYRKLAGLHHPDKGGSQEGWNRIQEAYEQAMARFQT